MNMVRSLLTRSGVPKQFWPEAVKWSVHVLNRSPTYVVQNMTPEEAWNGRRLSVEHFRMFGCIAYAHVPDEKRKKLDDKGEKCVFLGVSTQSKAYKLYNPNTKKIIISRDVVFDDENIWEWSDNDNQQIGADFDDENQDEEQQPPAENPLPAAKESERPQRIRRRPAWMEEYEVSGIDQTDDPLTHFVLFSDCDPTTFEEAVKEAKWRTAMDEEIAAVERNNTWELMELPKGHKTIGVKQN